MQGESPTQASTPARATLLGSLKRWVSLRAYGLVTSTLFGATTSPLLLLVGENELLLDDALRVRDAAASKGADARVLIGDGMQHDWPLTLPWLDESRAAWQAICTFVEEHSHQARRR